MSETGKQTCTHWVSLGRKELRGIIAALEAQLSEAKAGWDSSIADLREAAKICAEVEAQLAACEWRPIARKGPFPDNEQLVLAQTTEPLYRVMRFSSHLRKFYSDEGVEATVRDISAWMPINPPQQGAK